MMARIPCGFDVVSLPPILSLPVSAARVGDMALGRRMAPQAQSPGAAIHPCDCGTVIAAIDPDSFARMAIRRLNQGFAAGWRAKDAGSARFEDRPDILATSLNGNISPIQLNPP